MGSIKTLCDGYYFTENNVFSIANSRPCATFGRHSSGVNDSSFALGMNYLWVCFLGLINRFSRICVVKRNYLAVDLQMTIQAKGFWKVQVFQVTVGITELPSSLNLFFRNSVWMCLNVFTNAVFKRLQLFVSWSKKGLS